MNEYDIKTININPFVTTTKDFNTNPSVTTTDTITQDSIKNNQYNFAIKYDFDKIAGFLKDANEFKKIEELVPFKVYRFTFLDNTVIKTVCANEDPFDLEYAFYLALAKKKFSCSHTFEGVLYKADTLRYEKYYANLVKQGMKLFKKQQLEEAKRADEERLRKEQYRKYVAKKKARDERRAAQSQENLKEIIKEAIKLSKEEG